MTGARGRKEVREAGLGAADVFPVFKEFLDAAGVRYEAWHRFRRPAVAIDADVVHAPSLAVPPSPRVPLVVTVHDISFERDPGLMSPRDPARNRPPPDL